MAESGEQQAPTRRTTLRGRAVLVVGLAAMVVVSGLALQRAGLRAAPSGSLNHSVSGAWFCPHGGSAEWKAWVVVTNPSRTKARVRVTTFGGHGVLARSTFELGGSRQAERSVPASEAGAATEVEYFGTWVAASTYLVSDATPPRAAASRCAPSPEPHWYVADANTGAAETSNLVVMNPFSQDAAVDVIIRTDKRPAVRPGALSPLVVRAGTSAVIRLNDYVLQAPDEALVSGQVDVRLGRVVTGGLTFSDAALRGETAVSTPGVRWVVPAGGYTASTSVSLFNPSSRRADLSVIAQGETTQTLLSGVGNVSLAPGAVRILELKEADTAGVVVESTNGVPIVVARRVSGDQGDPATIQSSALAGRSWVVPASLSPAGGRSMVTLENPGRTDVVVTLRFIGKAGSVPAPSVGALTIPAGRMAVVDISAALGNRPISVVVAATGGTIVAGCASYSPGGAGFASTLGEIVPTTP